ncbi:PEP-CTERM sorting domain-containing protein [Bythopirellula goksoeyrii]|nr:PEP-CTERM sorting domain-containing protein [Bythopirellula goksoeyrii]
MTVAIMGFFAVTTSTGAVLFDFGNDDAPVTGVNVVLQSTAVIADLVDTTGASTGISFTLVDSGGTPITPGFELFPGGDDFRFHNESGETAVSGEAASYFGAGTNSITYDSLWGDIGDPGVHFKLEGLTPNTAYYYTFYASRKATTSPSRNTLFSVDGGPGVTLDAIENSSEVAHLTALSDATGSSILFMGNGLEVAPAPDSEFWYIQAMQIEAIPEPSSLLLLVSTLGAIAVRRWHR